MRPLRRAWISVDDPVSEVRKTKRSSWLAAPRSNRPSPANCRLTSLTSSTSSVGGLIDSRAAASAASASASATPRSVSAVT